tara:strand:- start:57 stop:506 length:450 start_codon:yes stop_codon:yes gene_type:complete
MENPINKLFSFWEHLGSWTKRGSMIIAFISMIVAFRPYIDTGVDFIKKFVFSVQYTEQNSEDIKGLQKYVEVTSSILKNTLEEYYFTNPSGCKVKLYKSKKEVTIEGIPYRQVYYFKDCCQFYGVKLDVEKEKYGYVTKDGDYNLVNCK